MKVKNILKQSVALFMCVIVLSLSVGSKFCVYDNISKTYAADPFTLTMGSLALEEVILGIAIAVLGADVAYQYRDEIIDSYKEFSANGNNLYAGQNLYEIYSNGERSVRTWDEYEEIAKGMGSTASEKFEDYADSFNNVFIRPCKEYMQYVADFYTRLFTGTAQVGDDAYIEGLSEYLAQEFFTGYNYQNGLYYYNLFYQQNNLLYYLNSNSSSAISKHYAVMTGNTLKFYQWSQGKSGNINIGLDAYKNNEIYFSRTMNSIDLTQVVNFGCNYPIFESIEVAEEAMLLVDYSSAMNYGKSMDAIAIPGDDIPTVGNWEDLWEKLKNPDLPWWFCNPDALGLANTSDLPWFDVAGLNDWAQDIPNIRDGIIENNIDIPWTDVWEGVISIPDVIVPAIDFPIVDDPAKPGETEKPTATPLPTPLPGEGTIYTKPVVDLSKFFPFCVPFDLIHLIKVLDAEPVAPRWEVKLEPPLFPVEWEIVIDMADFEALAKIFRTGETLLFVVGLILITRGIIKG